MAASAFAAASQNYDGRVERGRKLLSERQAAVDRDREERLSVSPGLRHLVDALFSATLDRKGDEATASIEIKGFRRRELAALIEMLSP